jgi:hypothetical protein
MTRTHRMNMIPSDPAAPAQAPRAPWEAPAVTRLPRLTELTLATGGGIPGNGDIGGGSTVIP